MTVISVTKWQLSRLIWFNTSSVSMKESNINVTSVTMTALPSLILEGAKSQNMRVLDPPVQSEQYVKFEQCAFGTVGKVCILCTVCIVN